MTDERQSQFEKQWNENVTIYRVYRFEWLHKDRNGSFNVYTNLNDLVRMTTARNGFWLIDVDNVMHVFGAFMAEECKFTFYEINE